MNCPKCGKELVENAKFCTGCGCKLEIADSLDGNGYVQQGMPMGNGYPQQGMPQGTRAGNGIPQPGMPQGAPMGNGYAQQGMPQGTPMGNGYTQPGMPQGTPMGNGYAQQGMPMGNGYPQQGMPMGNGYAQQVRQPNPLVQKLGNILLDIFRNPVNACKEMGKWNEAGFVFLILGIQAILCGLLMMGISRLAKDGIEALFYGVGGSIDAEYGKVFIIGLFGAFGINMMTALWYFLFTGKMAKRQTNFINACSVVAVKGIINVCLLLVAILFCGINFGIGLLFFFCSTVIGWLYMFAETTAEGQDSNALFGGRILVVLCSVFANSLWVYVLLKVIAG